jgi:hypothetical protein
MGMRAPLQAPDVAVPETEQGTDCESVYVDSNSTGHPNFTSCQGYPSRPTGQVTWATNHELGIRILHGGSGFLRVFQWTGNEPTKLGMAVRPGPRRPCTRSRLARHSAVYGTVAGSLPVACAILSQAGSTAAPCTGLWVAESVAGVRLLIGRGNPIAGSSPAHKLFLYAARL